MSSGGWDKVRQIFEGATHGMLATAVDGQPKVRPMAWVLLDDGRLWSSTYRCSGKAAELEGNPKVEVCFVDGRKVQLRFEGRARFGGTSAERKRLLELNPKVGRHFNGPDDPQFALIEVVPTHVRWTEPGFGDYHDVTPPTDS